MKNVLTVFKKEMHRYFTDPRMLIALFLPGVLILVMYSLAGRFFASSVFETKVENTTYRVAYTDNNVDNPPRLIKNFSLYVENNEKETTNKVEYFTVDPAKVEEAKNLVIEGKYDVLAVFSDNFETTKPTEQSQVPNHYIYLFYNGATPAATRAYSILNSLVDTTYKDYYYNLDPQGKPIQANIASSDYASAKVMSVLVPVLTMSLLFSSVIAVCPDAIAGEKERGTLAAMLLTPIKRSELAFGKILSLSVVAVASGLVSFLGLMGGLPALMQGMNLTLAPLTVVLLGILIITTLLLFVSIGTAVSAFAKTAKECSSYMAPMMVIAMGAALLPMAIDATSLGWAFVPFLNIASCMNRLIETGAVGLPFMGVTVAMNVVYTALVVFAVSKMFHSERLMVK